MSDTLVYLILGARGSSRRAVVSDLIEFGLKEEDKSLVAVSEGEPDQNPLDVRKREVDNRVYAWNGEDFSLEVADEVSTVFVVADGASDPADFVEAFHAWLQESGLELGRVLTVLNCDLFYKNKELNVWFDCCIHYSDMVLLSERQGVPNKWVSELMERYEKRCFPCTFEYVKKGRVSNPVHVLFPEPRRISMLFDPSDKTEAEEEYGDFVVLDEEEKEIEIDEEEEEESIAGDPTKDVYLKRIANGRRDKPVPQIAPFLK